MSNKLNIEELKYLIPDYITGDISAADKAAVEDGLRASAELREFHGELSGAFNFLGTVKHEEPPQQYWANMIPRLHERIEAEQAKKLSLDKLSWSNISAVWKVLVPVTAIILIAVVYYMVIPSDTQITKDDKKIENINKDTNKEPKQENKQPESQENKIIQPEQDNIVKETPIQKKPQEQQVPWERRAVRSYDDNMVKDELPNNNDEEIQLPVNGDVASIELDETSIFSAGESAGLDEDIEDDIKKLDNKELDKFLNELENSNL